MKKHYKKIEMNSDAMIYRKIHPYSYAQRKHKFNYSSLNIENNTCLCIEDIKYGNWDIYYEVDNNNLISVSMVHESYKCTEDIYCVRDILNGERDIIIQLNPAQLQNKSYPITYDENKYFYHTDEVLSINYPYNDAIYDICYTNDTDTEQVIGIIIRFDVLDKIKDITQHSTYIMSLEGNLKYLKGCLESMLGENNVGITDEKYPKLYVEMNSCKYWIRAFDCLIIEGMTGENYELLPINII